MWLNLVFHDIVRNKKEICSPFCITKDYFFQLTENLLNLTKQNKTKFKETCFYFDDGYQSFKNIVFPKIRDNYQGYALAIVTDWMDKDGFLNQNDIINFKIKGIKIYSHGISHSALAVYKNDKLQKTPKGGDYKNTPNSKKNILKYNEVFYQLQESKIILKKIIGEVDEFVLPYGLYNDDTIKINQDKKIYKFLSTCDEFLD